MKMQIMLHRPPRVARLLIPPRGDSGSDRPKGHENGHEGEEGEEYPCEEPTADFHGEVARDEGK